MRPLVFILLLPAPRYPLRSLVSRDISEMATMEVELKSVQGQLDYTADTKFRYLLIREVEVRLRENSLGDGIEDYKLRLSPINPFEKNASALSSQLNTEYRWKFNDVLKKRYLHLINHFLMSKLISVYKEKLAFYDNILVITNK